MSVVSAMAARGQCNSLSPLPQPSTYPPSPFQLRAGERDTMGGNMLTYRRNRGGSDLKRNKQHEVHRSRISVLLPPRSHSISCFQMHLTHPSPFLSLFLHPLLHPILHILQMWAHLSPHPCTLSRRLTKHLPEYAERAATLSSFPAQCWPRGPVTLTGRGDYSYEVLVCDSGQTMWQNLIPERLAAAGPPSPTGREGVTGE